MSIEIVYPLATDSWDEKEIGAIDRVVKSGRFSMGKEVKNFESEVSKMFGHEYSIMVNYGSSANLVMLAALKILKGNDWPDSPEIIVPSVSWSTTYTPLYFLGIKPKFVDVDRATLGLNVSDVADAINSNTVAILVVNVLGQPADLVGLSDLAKKHGIELLEDNCESLGATLGGKATGSFGLASSHSSFFSHHISTMEGGWISTSDPVFYQTCLSLRAHGWVREQPADSIYLDRAQDKFNELFHFVLPGLNFRPIEMEAAIGIEQLIKLPSMIKTRRENLKCFQELFGRSKNVRLQSGPGETSSFALSIVLQGDMVGRRSELAEAFMSRGIECRPVIAGNFTKQPVVKYLTDDEIPVMPVADEIHFNGMYLGNHPKNLEFEIEEAWKVFSSISD